jgi:multicomponent Na+:H+ antiporter subunit G
MTASVVFNLITAATLLAGLFFLLTGALGVWRLPDLYHRMIASSKCITLGITGMLLASVVHLAVLARTPQADGQAPPPSTSVVAVGTKAILVIVFQFIAAPVGAFVLARAAHQDNVPKWAGTLGDELAEDNAKSEAA